MRTEEEEAGIRRNADQEFTITGQNDSGHERSKELVGPDVLETRVKA